MFKTTGAAFALMLASGLALAQPSPSPSASPASSPSPVVLPTAPPGPVPPAELGYPQGIALDPQGNLIVSDRAASGIFRITPDKQVQRIGQWSPELKQQAIGPWIYSNFQGVLLDSDGTLVSPDPSARTLWRIQPDGKISKIVQDFVHFDLIQGICADGAGNYVLADPKLGIVRVTRDGKATFLVEIDMTRRLPLRNPRGIVRDKDGSFVVADGSLRGVFRVSPQGAVTPIATGKPFSFPQGITQDADGSFLVPDNYAQAIFRVTADGKVSPLLQGAPLSRPRNVVPDGKGAYYVTDPGVPAILKISKDGAGEVWLPIKGSRGRSLPPAGGSAAPPGPGSPR